MEILSDTFTCVIKQNWPRLTKQRIPCDISYEKKNIVKSHLNKLDNLLASASNLVGCQRAC